LAAAGRDQLSFLANPAYRPALAETSAGAVVLTAGDADNSPVDCLVAEDPYLAYARIARDFDRRPLPPAGVHPGAHVDPSARLGDGVHVGASAVIGANCDIGDGCMIGPGCVLGPGCRVGAGSRLTANVTLTDGVQLGERVLVHPGAVLGADGFGIAFAGDHWEKVPQLGRVIVGDDCEIGANSTIDRGAIEDTVLEADVRIDNLVQIGHNVRIGAHTAIAGCVGIAGSTRIGRNCLVGGASGIGGHLEIADRVTITANSMVVKSIDEAGSTWSSGLPAMPQRAWNRVLGRLKNIDELARLVRRLAKKTDGKPR
ncbi:MAG: UDP-3-O-(3-hydroxymyristoyl)glucosamine N-acyltransferase, partial [Xanthomonadales bacterium]|nr:UDP-3-O-(3-hydroxymyristoyl)glucosamine N-acyltransferase [Xanthomonadales bacterium]